MQVQVNQSQKSNTPVDAIQLDIFTSATKSDTPEGKESDVVGKRPITGSIAECEKSKNRAKNKQAVNNSSNFDFVGVAG